MAPSLPGQKGGRADDAVGARKACCASSRCQVRYSGSGASRCPSLDPPPPGDDVAVDAEDEGRAAGHRGQEARRRRRPVSLVDVHHVRPHPARAPPPPGARQRASPAPRPSTPAAPPERATPAPAPHRQRRSWKHPALWTDRDQQHPGAGQADQAPGQQQTAVPDTPHGVRHQQHPQRLHPHFRAPARRTTPHHARLILTGLDLRRLLWPHPGRARRKRGDRQGRAGRPLGPGAGGHKMAGTVPVEGAATPAGDGAGATPGGTALRAPSAELVACSRPSRLSAATRLCSKVRGTETPSRATRRLTSSRVSDPPRGGRRGPHDLAPVPAPGALVPDPGRLLPAPPAPVSLPPPRGWTTRRRTGPGSPPPASCRSRRRAPPAPGPAAPQTPQTSPRRGTRTSGRRGSPGSGGTGDTDPGAEVHQALIPVIRPSPGGRPRPGARPGGRPPRRPAPPARRCAPGRARTLVSTRGAGMPWAKQTMAPAV